jgi:hypothetical protein
MRYSKACNYYEFTRQVLHQSQVRTALVLQQIAAVVVVRPCCPLAFTVAVVHNFTLGAS